MASISHRDERRAIFVGFYNPLDANPKSLSEWLRMQSQ